MDYSIHSSMNSPLKRAYYLPDGNLQEEFVDFGHVRDCSFTVDCANSTVIFNPVSYSNIEIDSSVVFKSKNLEVFPDLYERYFFYFKYINAVQTLTKRKKIKLIKRFFKCKKPSYAQEVCDFYNNKYQDKKIIMFYFHTENKIQSLSDELRLFFYDHKIKTKNIVYSRIMFILENE